MIDVRQIIDTYGGAAALARRIGISRNAVWQWRERNQVPADRVLEVEKITGIARHHIRPDIYPATATPEPAGAVS